MSDDAEVSVEPEPETAPPAPKPKASSKKEAAPPEVESFATTTDTKDYLGRALVDIATNAKDHMGRLIQAGDLDYLGRATVA